MKGPEAGSVDSTRLKPAPTLFEATIRARCAHHRRPTGHNGDAHELEGRDWKSKGSVWGLGARRLRVESVPVVSESQSQRECGLQGGTVRKGTMWNMWIGLWKMWKWNKRRATMAVSHQSADDGRTFPATFPVTNFTNYQLPFTRVPGPTVKLSQTSHIPGALHALRGNCLFRTYDPQLTTTMRSIPGSLLSPHSSHAIRTLQFDRILGPYAPHYCRVAPSSRTVNPGGSTS